MANATAKVPSAVVAYGDDCFDWPLKGGATVARTYQNGEMIGRRSDGYAVAMDDSVALDFLGIVAEHPVTVAAGDADGAKTVRLRRPYRIEMPLASGTASLATNAGAPLYAVYSGTVSLSGGSFGNVVGYLSGVVGTTPASLTGAVVIFEPPTIANFGGTGELAGDATVTTITGDTAPLAIAGLASTTGGAVSVTGGTSSTSGNAGGAVSLVGGTPGATGAGGAVSVTGGAGGSTSGTGGAVAIAAGAGTAGNANGGAVTILAGAKHSSGTAGTIGIGTSNTSAITIGAASVLTRNAGYFQAGGNAAVTATTGGATTGLIPAGASFVTVTSDSADKQISLPAGVIGDVIRILVGTTACELISAVAADKVNEVTVGATNELALTAEALYTCTYTKSGFWIVTGETKLGARIAALVPDTL